MESGICEPIVKRDEGQRLTHLALQIEATGELQRVAGPKAVAEQECPRVCRNLLCQLNNEQGHEILCQRRQRPVPFLEGKRAFPGPTHQC